MTKHYRILFFKKSQEIDLRLYSYSSVTKQLYRHCIELKNVLRCMNVSLRGVNLGPADYVSRLTIIWIHPLPAITRLVYGVNCPLSPALLWPWLS
jgi:hypothetical protein